MSRTILALALASSVSALLPAKVPGRVRGVYSAPLASSALLSMRSRPPYMSIDPDAHAKIAAASYSSGFSDGLNAAAMVGAPKEAEAGPLLQIPPPSVPVIFSPEFLAALRCKDAAKHIKGVDGPLLQTLATACCTIEDAMPEHQIPNTEYVPVEGEVDDKLDQPYKVTIGGCGALDVFKSVFKDVFKSRSGKPDYSVIDGITDFHDELEVAIPPFAALVVQPKDEMEVQTYSKPPPCL